MPGQPINIKGQKFGRWTVLYSVPNLKSRDAKWMCECECGTQREVLGKNLRNGRSTSCGCYKKECDSKAMAERNKLSALNLTNKKYGLLTAIEPTEKRTAQGSVIWKCVCECGKYHFVSANALRGKHPIRSCGCSTRSLGATYIINILQKNSINFIDEYIFSDLPKSKFDFAIIENDEIKRLIEFDGEQHYYNVANWDNVELQQKRDKIKNDYALSHDIPLVRIPYWERDNITLEMIMGDKYLVR